MQEEPEAVHLITVMDLITSSQERPEVCGKTVQETTDRVPVETLQAICPVEVLDGTEVRHLVSDPVLVQDMAVPTMFLTIMLRIYGHRLDLDLTGLHSVC